MLMYVYIIIKTISNDLIIYIQININISIETQVSHVNTQVYNIGILYVYIPTHTQ